MSYKYYSDDGLSINYKLSTGYFMEYFIANNLKCPECKKNKLYACGDNIPSRDIICRSCKQTFEIKSKCLSVPKLPKDVRMHHGLYNEYIRQKENGINFIIVIYGVDKYESGVYIREILYASNFDIDNNLFVNRNTENANSIINIPDRTKLNKLFIEDNKRFIKTN